MVEKLVLDHVLLCTLADQTKENLTIAVGNYYLQTLQKRAYSDDKELKRQRLKKKKKKVGIKEKKRKENSKEKERKKKKINK